MKLASSALTFDRPLGLGEIFDRALLLLVLSWRPIVTLAACAYLPWVVLHLWESAQFLNLTIGAAPESHLISFLYGAILTTRDLASVEPNSWRWAIGIGARVLFFLSTCAIAVVAAGRIAGVSVSALDALRAVNSRWEVVGPVAVIASVGAFCALEATESIKHQFETYMGSDLSIGAIAARYIVAIVTTWAAEGAAFAMTVWAIAAGLWARDFTDSIRCASGALFGRRRVALTFWFSVALYALSVPFGALDALGAGALSFSRNVFSYALIDSLTRIAFDSVAVLLAFLYLLDAQVRNGVDAVTAFAQRAKGEEAFWQGPK